TNERPTSPPMRGAGYQTVSHVGDGRRPVSTDADRPRVLLTRARNARPAPSRSAKLVEPGTSHDLPKLEVAGSIPVRRSEARVSEGCGAGASSLWVHRLEVMHRAMQNRASSYRSACTLSTAASHRFHISGSAVPAPGVYCIRSSRSPISTGRLTR